jgi:hypothetical protein
VVGDPLEDGLMWLSLSSTSYRAKYTNCGMPVTTHVVCLALPVRCAALLVDLAQRFGGRAEAVFCHPSLMNWVTALRSTSA